MRAALVLACLPFVVVMILRSPVLGAATFIYTDFVRPQDLTWGFEEVRFALVVALATLVGYLINRRKFDPVRAPRSEPWLVALLLAMLLSSATAAVSVETSLDWNTRFVKIVIFCAILARVTDTRARLDRILSALVFGVGLLAAWAFEQHFRGNERLEGIGNGGDQNNSNHLGAIFCLALPINVAVAANARRGSWTRVGAMALIPVMLADIVFTQSRAAYLATAALAGAALLKKKIRKKVLGWAIVCGVLGGIVGLQKFAERAETIVSQGKQGARAEDGSIGLRFILWGHAVDYLAQSPVTGVGQQNSALLIKHDTNIAKAKSIHNTYLQLAADGGLACLLLWIATMLAGFRDARAAQREALDAGQVELWRVGLALELGLSGFAAASMFHSFDYLELPYWVVTLAGVARGLVAREASLARVREAA
jgi:probable O-glycosylation ligase (exosortase A-associated)